MLFIDETESVSTDIPAFKRYLEINEGLVRSQGAELFVGKKLAGCVFDAELVESRVSLIPVASWRAATWFYPNIKGVWPVEKHVTGGTTAAERAELSGEIQAIMESKDSSVKTLWKMRRMILKRKEAVT
jgi:hypothetical protein